MKTTITTMLLLALCLVITGCGQVCQTPIENNLSGWSFYSENSDARQRDTWEIIDGVLICSGTPRGYLYTNESYRDFTLTLQWRWPDEKSAGKGGVLFDMTGVDNIWPTSLEAQINSGSAGDFWALDGYGLTGVADRTELHSHPEYGELVNVKKIEAAENAAGQWNSYKIVAEGADVTLTINGQVVNKATRTNTTGGKICITSEGSGIEFRDIKIDPK